MLSISIPQYQNKPNLSITGDITIYLNMENANFIDWTKNKESLTATIDHITSHGFSF
jgi:hypothetical protein